MSTTARGSPDDETHDFFTRLMDESGAMLWGRVTYEMMESYWPAVARGAEEAPPAMREWAVKLEAKPKYVVSSTRTDFPWTNSHHIGGDLRAGVQRLKDASLKGVLLGSGKLATELDRLEFIDRVRVSSFIPGSPATARPCTRAVCPRRGSSSWSRRGRSAAARWRCTTAAPADLQEPHGGQLAGERDVEDRGGDPQMLRNQGLELVAGTGTRAPPLRFREGVAPNANDSDLHHNLSLIPRKTPQRLATSPRLAQILELLECPVLLVSSIQTDIALAGTFSRRGWRRNSGMC